MEQKILTISIAAYNVEKFIQETLESLLDEDTADKLEIFVIDDGGRDRTLEIALDYEKRFPGTVYAIHKENGGYGSTLNYGISHATGRYFRQLDGDDWFEKKNLKGYLEFLSKTEADLVLTPYTMVYADGTIRDVDRHKLPEDIAGGYPGYKGMKLFDFTPGSLLSIRLHELAVRTALLQENHVTLSERRFYTDTEYVFYPCLYAETIIRYPEHIYCYRMGEAGQSVSLEGRIRHWTDMEDIFVRVADDFEDRKELLCSAVKDSLTEHICEIIKFQISNYIIYPDRKEAYKRCRDFSEKVRRYSDLYQEACGRFTFVKRITRSTYLGFCLLCRYYYKRVS